MRSKVLYSVLVFAVLIIGASALFGSVTIGDQVKVIKDFGLFALSLLSVLYCVISGSTLLFKELARKTVFNILSKPVRRWEFLTGKFLGIFSTSVVLLFCMGILFSSFTAFFERSIDFELFRGYFHIALELMIICSAVILFSSIVVTPILIGLFSFGLFLAGRSLNVLLYLIDEGFVSGGEAIVVKSLYWGLPQLHTININDALVYQIAVPHTQSIWALIYAISYSAVLLVLAQMLFQRREFN
ncbi:MAG: ABC transporter permease subunit [Bdellovibrionales bacterium]|nr:ABC transporter permease subunit [Bdellovibrionales bacterium]